MGEVGVREQFHRKNRWRSWQAIERGNAGATKRNGEFGNCSLTPISVYLAASLIRQPIASNLRSFIWR